MATKSKFEVISTADVTKSPRGRKAELDSDLMGAFGQITDDEMAIRLSGYGPFTTKEGRAKFSTIVRKNWCAVHGSQVGVKVNYSTDGIAQVQRGKVAAE